MPADTVPAVVVRDLTVRYGPQGGTVAVDGLTLQAHSGEVLVVLGPNGAGKTSTIESLEGYRRPAGGRITVLGLDPIADHRQLTGRMGVMLQNGGVYPMLGPRRVLDLFSSYYSAPLGTEALLDLVALRAVAEAYGGLGAVAAQAGISRESLYRALSPKGNPTLKTLIAVMKTLGLRLSVAEMQEPNAAHAKESNDYAAA